MERLAGTGARGGGGADGDLVAVQGERRGGGGGPGGVEAAAEAQVPAGDVPDRVAAAGGALGRVQEEGRVPREGVQARSVLAAVC